MVISNSAYDILKEQKNNTNPNNIKSISICSSITSDMFHPKNLNSKFKAPKSTISNACTVDPLDKIDDNMDELNFYEKESELGKGTDAYVYEIVDRRNKSHFAMKLTKRKSGRYRTEIHLLYQLRNSPFIVKLFKVLENDDVYVLILEQAPLTLETLLHEKCTTVAMTELVAKDITLNILLGLKAIHSFGFVHKDIKPENILIFANRKTKSLQAKIADFGFATRCSFEYSITKEKLAEFRNNVIEKCGTPGFWAPELITGLVDMKDAFKLDIFSAGVSIYRTLCNEMPFGLFETWNYKIDKKTNIRKLEKLKPTFQVVSWIRTKKNEDKKIDYIKKLTPKKLSNNSKNLLIGMLKIRPQQRYNIDICLKHPWLIKVKK